MLEWLWNKTALNILTIIKIILPFPLKNLNLGGNNALRDRNWTIIAASGRRNEKLQSLNELPSDWCVWSSSGQKNKKNQSPRRSEWVCESLGRREKISHRISLITWNLNTMDFWRDKWFVEDFWEGRLKKDFLKLCSLKIFHSTKFSKFASKWLDMKIKIIFLSIVRFTSKDDILKSTLKLIGFK
jgi:hypothetical protein